MNKKRKIDHHLHQLNQSITGLIHDHDHDHDHDLKIMDDAYHGSASDLQKIKASKSTAKDSWCTPRSSFIEIQPIVSALAAHGSLNICDPFYSDGSAMDNMIKAFGPNMNIIHQDKLVSLQPGTIPRFMYEAQIDLIVTNPPYSMKKEVLEWLISLKIPFMALMPASVAFNQTTSQIFDNHLQIIRLRNARVKFQRPVSSDTSGPPPRDHAWFCSGINLSRMTHWRTGDTLKEQLAAYPPRPLRDPTPIHIHYNFRYN